STLQPIEGVVRTPSFDRELQLLLPGYNAEVATWYDGPEVPRSWALTHLRALLADFPFREDGSVANLIGYLVSTLLHAVTGKSPLLVIGANMPGVGKTTLAKLVGLLVDGQLPSSVSYTDADDSFEKALGAKLRQDARTILIDNARVRSARMAVTSSVLERFV